VEDAADSEGRALHVVTDGITADILGDTTRGATDAAMSDIIGSAIGTRGHGRLDSDERPKDPASNGRYSHGFDISATNTIQYCP
jgi:hypothetical protein